ncbi:MAG: nitroreductase family protein [Lachnospiraceae bacterium]
MQLIDGIKTRRSVRKFEDKKVPHEVLEQIVEAAAFAPSWKNSQTVRYIAVEDAALKERIATEATMNFTHNKDIISACPVLIVVVTKTGICGYEKDGSLHHLQKGQVGNV